MHAIARSAPRLIIAPDDVAIGHLQSLRKTATRELAKLIDDSLGPSASYGIIASRAGLIAAAQSAGLDAPDCAEVATAAELKERLREFGVPAFLKADGTHGGEGVKLLRDLGDADAAFASMHPTASLFGAGFAKRERVISVQKAVEGQPANCCAFAWRGEVAAVVSVVTLETLHTFGVATVVRPVENAAMRHAARAIARKLKLSGFFGLDFILQDDGERAWVLELNPRPTPISHFALGPGRDLVAALIATLEGRPRAERPVTFRLGSSVSVFPHLLRRRGGGELHEDWPVGQPALVRAFARRRKLGYYRKLVRDRLGMHNSTAEPVHRSVSSEMSGS